MCKKCHLDTRNFKNLPTVGGGDPLATPVFQNFQYLNHMRTQITNGVHYESNALYRSLQEKGPRFNRNSLSLTLILV